MRSSRPAAAGDVDLCLTGAGCLVLLSSAKPPRGPGVCRLRKRQQRQLAVLDVGWRGEQQRRRRGQGTPHQLHRGHHQAPHSAALSPVWHRLLWLLPPAPLDTPPPPSHILPPLPPLPPSPPSAGSARLSQWPFGSPSPPHLDLLRAELHPTQCRHRNPKRPLDMGLLLGPSTPHLSGSPPLLRSSQGSGRDRMGLAFRVSRAGNRRRRRARKLRLVPGRVHSQGGGASLALVCCSLVHTAQPFVS